MSASSPSHHEFRGASRDDGRPAAPITSDDFLYSIVIWELRAECVNVRATHHDA